MNTYFNVVLDGHSAADCTGRELPDDGETYHHARWILLSLLDVCRDEANSFVAVTGSDGKLVFKIPFLEGSPGAGV
jgi:hypothetical protein